MSLSQEHRAAISRGQARRHSVQREQRAGQPDVAHKVCTGCQERKRVPDDYYMAQRRLADGTVRRYPPGKCRICSNKRKEEWKQRQLAEDPEGFRAKYREYNARRDQEARRRYNREWWRVRHGKGVRVWSQYANEPGARLHRLTVPTGPFLTWWRAISEEERHVVRQNESLERLISRVALGDQPAMEEATVDAAGVALGRPELLRQLYPDAT